MKIADSAVLTAVFAVVAAAILGGAFYPGPRIIVGLVLAVAGFAIAATFQGRLIPEEGLGLAFLVWAAVAAMMIGNNPLAAREVVTTWVVVWIVWLGARRASVEFLRTTIGLLVAGAIVVALGIMAEAYGLGHLRVGGFLENPNVAASLLVVSLPTVFVPGVISRREIRLVVAGLVVLGVVLSGSRAGLLAVLAALAVMWPRGRQRLIVLLVGGAGALGVLAIRLFSQPDLLAWFRPAIWWAVLHLWMQHPIAGVGAGGLVDAAGPVRILHPEHIGQRQFLINYAESTPLAVLVQTGIVGFLLVLVLAFLCFGRMRKSGLFSFAPLRGLLAAAAMMFAFHDLITVGVVLWWWAVAFGLCEVAAGGGEENRVQTGPGRQPYLVAGLVTAFVVLFGLVQPSWARWKWATSEHDPARVEQAIRAEPWFPAPSEWRVRRLLAANKWTWNDAAEALAHADRSVTVEPGSASSWGGLAMVHSRIVVDFGPWPDSVEGARAAFARATELEPHQPWHWLEWARFERGLGEIERALVLVLRATEAEPNTVRAWLLLARIELDLGDVTSSQRALERANESSALSGRLGLNRYERELVGAPAWQFQELVEALR